MGFQFGGAGKVLPTLAAFAAREGQAACSAGVPQPSHVLLAMGCDPVQARHPLRFSLGHTSTPEDVDAVVEAIGPAVERARAAKR